MKNSPALNEFAEHRRLLERAVNYFQPDDRIIALVVAGSIANGGVDFYSDVDLYIVTNEKSFDAVFAERDLAAEAVGQPLLRLIPDYKSKKGDQQYVVTYSNLIKVEYVYYRPKDMTPSPKWKNCLIFKDTNDFAAQIKAESQQAIPPQPTAEALLALNQLFWTFAWYSFGKIMRGELWEAFCAVDGIRSLAILQMLAWRNSYSHEGYRRLETKAEHYRSKLTETVAVLEAESLYTALQAEIRLFTELRDALFARHSLRYESEPEDVIKSEILHRWETG